MNLHAAILARAFGNEVDVQEVADESQERLFMETLERMDVEVPETADGGMADVIAMHQWVEQANRMMGGGEE